MSLQLSVCLHRIIRTVISHHVSHQLSAVFLFRRREVNGITNLFAGFLEIAFSGRIARGEVKDIRFVGILFAEHAEKMVAASGDVPGDVWAALRQFLM